MKISGWFRRNNTLMAQAKDLARQLQEAWDESDQWEGLCGRAINEASDNLDLAKSYSDQLHRVARERDKERRLRLEAEDRLLDRYMEEDEMTLKEIKNRYLPNRDLDELRGVKREEQDDDTGWGKRAMKPRRLRATLRHYLLALDTDDKEKLAIEEEKLRRYSGYNGWPNRHKGD